MLRGMLRIMDQGWRNRVLASPPFKQFGVIVAFALSFWMDDFVNVFWWATRSCVPWRIFYSAFTLGMALEYPKTHVTMAGLVAAADVLESGGGVQTLLDDLCAP